MKLFRRDPGPLREVALAKPLPAWQWLGQRLSWPYYLVLSCGHEVVLACRALPRQVRCDACGRGTAVTGVVVAREARGS